MFKKVKWFFQKVFKGYSDCDIWNLDYHLAKIIHKRLKKFKSLERIGYPGYFSSIDEWNKVLDKIIFAFEFVLSDYGTDESYPWYSEIWVKVEKKVSFTIGEKDIFSNRDYNKEKCKYYYTQYQEGMMLFAKYFSNFWD